MIWGIIAVIGGLILRARAVVLIPLVYLLARKDRDLGLIAYFFYAVALMNDVFVRDVLSFETLKVILLGAFPALMVLREILIGMEFRESYKFKKPEMEVFLDLRVWAFILTLVGLMSIVKLRYEYLYTPENQVSVATGLAIIFLLLALREDVKRLEIFGGRR